MCFHNAGGFDARSQHVVLCGRIVWLRDAIERVEVTAMGVYLTDSTWDRVDCLRNTKIDLSG